MAEMRLVHWNVRNAVGTDDQRRPDRVLRALLDARADAVSMNEVSPELSAHLREELERALGRPWFATWRPANPFDLAAGGNAVLSRIEPAQVHLKHLFNEPRDPRVLVGVELPFDGASVTLVSTHLAASSAILREQQVDVLCDWVSQLGVAVIAADFNAELLAPELRRLRERFEDVWSIARARATARAFDGNLDGRTHKNGRLDLVLVGDQAKVISAEMIDTRRDGDAFASDHHPLLVTLRV